MMEAIHQPPQQTCPPRRNEFKLLANYFQQLWEKGWPSANLWGYWAVSVIIVGGVGVWTSLVLKYFGMTIPSILLSLITFSPPIATTACLEFLFLSDKEWFLKGPAILATCVAGLIAILAGISMVRHICVAYIIAFLGVIFSFILSWFACARDPKFADRPNYSVPLGGDIREKVQGSSEGFTL